MSSRDVLPIPERQHVGLTTFNILPLDDRRVERLNADLAGRPQLVRGHRQLLFGGMGRLTENSVVVLENKSHAVTAQIVVAIARQ